MKEILYMYLPSCPYCKQADEIISELVSENENYGSIVINKVDETKDTKLAESLDYWYVPCMFVEGQKIHEGVPTIEKIRKVLDEALK